MKYLKNISEMVAKSLPRISYLSEVESYLIDLKDLGCTCIPKEFFFKSENKLIFSQKIFDYRAPEDHFNSNDLDARRSYIVYIRYKFSTLEINSEIAQEVLTLKNRLTDKFKNSEIVLNFCPDQNEYEEEEDFNMVYEILIITDEDLRSNKNILEK